MKKIIAFVLAFTLALGSFMVYAHSELLSVKDKVEITENIVYGDKSAVEGIKAQLNSTYRNLLFWETSFSPESENVDTKYRFSKYEESGPINYNYSGVSLNLSFQFSYNDANENSTGLTKAYYDILSSLSEGEEVTKGQTIGTVGNSAAFEIADEPHLHFEMLKDEETVDPTLYLK